MKFLLKKLNRMFIQMVPKCRSGDKFIAYIKFLRSHKRLPTKGYFNDRFFKIKTSDEILDVLRQYTSDKEFVKHYIAQTVGDAFNVRTKAILSSPEEILAYNFEVNDVVKPTHSCGLIEFVQNKDFDKTKIISWLDSNYYDISREANYRYLKPKIIVEEPIFGRTNVDDIKFFCVDGVVKLIQWDFDRHENHTRLLYDRNWISLDASLGYPKSKKTQSKPRRLAEMIEVAEKLARPFSLVRVDLYYDFNTDTFLVGEITHCHGSSTENFDSLASEIRVSKELFG